MNNVFFSPPPAILTHLAASNHNEIWAIVSESGIPAAAPAVSAAPVAPAPAAPVGKIGKGGKNTRAAANAAKSKLTPAVPVTPVTSPDIVFESGGMTAACGRIQNLFEDIIDKFPHTVPPLSTRQILASAPPDTVSASIFFSLNTVQLIIHSFLSPFPSIIE
jgi:hypothetical protein